MARDAARKPQLPFVQAPAAGEEIEAPNTCCVGLHLTPPVCLVVWTCVAVGFLLGTTSSHNALYLPAFLSSHFPSLRQKLPELLDPKLGSICTLADSANLRGFVALGAAGAAAGAAAAVPVTHALGRRTGIAAGILVFIMAQVLQTASVAPPMAWIGRLLAGAAGGLWMQAAYLEVVEIALPDHRGRLAALISAGHFLGMLCSGLIIFGIGSRYRGDAWRFIHAWPLWPALIMLACLMCMPESPASLIERGRVDEGRRALEMIRGPWYPHLNEEVARLLHEADLRRESPRLLSALFSRKHAPPLVGSLLLALSNAWANSLQQFVMPLLLGTSLDLQQSELVGCIITSTAALAGTVMAAVLVDRPSVGRRRLLAIGYAAIGAICAAMAGNTLAARERGRSEQYKQDSAWAGAALLGVVFLFVGVAPATVAPLYTAESFGLAARAVGWGLALALEYALTAVISYNVMPMLCYHPVSSATGVSSLLLFCSAPCAALLLVEPVELPLEAVSELWARHWL